MILFSKQLEGFENIRQVMKLKKMGYSENTLGLKEIQDYQDTCIY